MPTPLEDHFRNPRHAGPLDRADIDVSRENPVCGDLMRLYLRLGADRRVEAASFQVYGCPAAIACGSLLTELVLGRGREDLAAIDQEAIDRAMGGLGSERAHAAILAADVVRAARDAFPDGVSRGQGVSGGQAPGPGSHGTRGRA